MTLNELKAEMDKIRHKLKALQEITPRNDEEQETILEQAGKLQAEGKRLGDAYRALRAKGNPKGL